MKKLLNQINLKTVFVLSAAVVLNSCGKERPQKDFIARVDKSYLTAKELSADLDTSRLETSRKNEYIRNWIETELLYREAAKEDILDSDEYLKTLEKSKKELAKALLIGKILDDNKPEFKPEELEEYYNLHKDEFRLFHDSYLFNSASFNDEDKAVLFRSTLIETDWTKAINAFRGDSSTVQEKQGVFLNDYKVQPNKLLLALQGLMPGEISIVINTEPSRFTVVQLIKKYSKDEIPEFEVAKQKAEERFLIEMRQKIIRDYIKNLYSKYQVEIKARK
ncbi:MAG: peptidyl-prolyl cis-trans isomerase [Ignavibacteriales bacterium]